MSDFLINGVESELCPFADSDEVPICNLFELRGGKEWLACNHLGSGPPENCPLKKGEVVVKLKSDTPPALKPEKNRPEGFCENCKGNLCDTCGIVDCPVIRASPGSGRKTSECTSYEKDVRV